MELIVVLAVAIPLALAVWLIVRAVSARHRIEELSRRLYELEGEVFRLKKDKPPAGVAAPIVEEPAPAPQPVDFLAPPVPPPIDEILTTPPPVEPITFPPSEAALREPQPAMSVINWEQFMGVKGFAWMGGFALFLGVAFFIKYSFDNNLVPPQLRVAVGFLTGLGLLVGGVAMSPKNFPALSQTLCATGVVVLYAVVFACRSIYHFEFCQFRARLVFQPERRASTRLAARAALRSGRARPH